MAVHPRLLLVPLACLLLIASGCSDDDDAATSSAPATDAADASEAGSSDDDGAAGAQQALADAVGGDGERPFGVKAEDLAVAMQAATRADRVEIDGNTFRLYFDEGSVEDVTARTKCSAMNMIKGDDDSVVMVHSDGELHCDDEPE